MSPINLHMLAFFNALSPMHIILILVVALLLFGNRLPEVARSFGRAINEFKKGMKEVGDNADDREENPRLTNNETRRTEDGSKEQQKQSEKAHEDR